MLDNVMSTELKNGKTLGRYVLYNGDDPAYTIKYAGFYYRRNPKSINILSSKVKVFEEFTLGEFTLKKLKELVNQGVVKFYRTTLPGCRKQAWVYKIDIGGNNG